MPAGFEQGRQEAFDRFFDRAKMHTSAGVYMSHPWPMETIFLSISLEHGKMIKEILGLLKEKKGQHSILSLRGRTKHAPLICVRECYPG